MSIKILLIATLFVFTTMLQGTENFPGILGKWDGTTHRGWKDIRVEFLPQSIKLTIAGKETHYQNVSYTQSEKNTILITANENFKTLGIASNQFEVMKKRDGIRILHNGHTKEELFAANEDTLQNGWDVKSQSMRNKKCIYPLILNCFEVMKQESTLLKADAKFSFDTLKQSQDAILINRIGFPGNQLMASYQAQTTEYKIMDQCVTYLIDNYTPSEYWVAMSKNRKILDQKLSKMID